MIDWNGTMTNSMASLSGYSTSTLLKWLNISTYFTPTRGFSFWGNDKKASRNDVKQGAIGNCWLLSAISACAELPGTIEKNFGENAVTSFNNKVGFYDVQLNYLNVPITIRVDDLIPAYNSFTTTLFSAMVNGGVWTPVMEKAFAKLYGNYSALVGYWSQIAIANIIGTPGFKVYIFNSATGATLSSATIWTYVNDASVDDVMVANTRSTSVFGMTASHAYTIVNNYEVKLLNGATVRLIRLRNPYATDGSQTTAYGDCDAEW
jgi:hypothetical protein